MADLTSADVTVTCNLSDMERIGRMRENLVTISFGDGSKTIPSGGEVPLPAISKFGIPGTGTIKSLQVVQGAGAYIFDYNPTTHALKVYHGDYSNASDGPLVAAGGVAIASQTLKAWVRGK